MSNFTMNSSELVHKASLFKQRGQTLKSLASKLTMQANTFNSTIVFKAATPLNSRVKFDTGLLDCAKLVSVRNAANRLSRFGNWLITLATAIENIVESAMYDDNVDEEYVRRTLLAIESPENFPNNAGSSSDQSHSNVSDDNYWLRSMDYVVKGDYSDNFTAAGLAGNVAFGFTPVGWIADGRDLIYSLTHTRGKSFWENFGEISLGIIAFVPIIGDIKNVKYLKYADEAGDVVKHADEAVDVSKGFAKKGDNILDGIRDTGKGSFKSGDLLETHFSKHGHEFGDITKEEYLKRAQELTNLSPGGDILIKTRKNGDILVYNKATNEFAVKASDGTIRTLFKPSEGIDYFNRQN